MGLDVSHGCFHGAYSAFHRWRVVIAQAADIPLMCMEAFYGNDSPGGVAYDHYWSTLHDANASILRYHYEEIEHCLPIKWSVLRPRPLHDLLHHSDCDGYLAWPILIPLANDLESLLPDIRELETADAGHIGQAGGYTRVTEIFIDGLWLAAAQGENVEFY